MTDDLVSGTSLGQRWRSGPLAPHVEAFARRLLELGYTGSTRRAKLRVVADFGRWLERRGRVLPEVDEHIVGEYQERCRRGGDSTTLCDLVEALRSAGVVPPTTPAALECPRRRV